MNIKKTLKKCDWIVEIYHRLRDLYFRFLTIISPTLNTKARYKERFGKKIDLKTPKTFNEKILKMKLDDYGKNQLIHECADKYTVREYVKQCGCEEILIPMIASYNKVSDIEWNKLPNNFVMKWNFGCGYNIICKDKSNIDKNAILKQMSKWGKREYYLDYSELQYKNVNKKIIVEEFLQPNGKALPDDFKFFCFDGKVEFIMVCTNRRKENGCITADFTFFDKKWKVYPFSAYAINNNCKSNYPRPNNLDKAINYAEKLAKPFKFVRTDLYLCQDEIYFGELTFTPSGGLDTDLFEGDKIMGDLIQL